MSREVRRVPTDFDWPLNKVWDGYLMPDKLREDQCPDCYGRGSTPAHQWIERIGLMLSQLVEDIDDNAAGKPMHPWLEKDTYPPVDRENILSRRGFWIECAVVRPTPDIIEFAQALVKDDEDEHRRTIERGPFSHNQDRITRGLLRMAGMPEKWGWCSTCHGRGSVEAYEGQRGDADAWEATEPPAGEGWQLWETVSDGSPVTPVFAVRDGLIDHLCSPAYPNRLTRDEAEGLVSAGWCPSGFSVTGRGYVPGEMVEGDFARVVLGLRDRDGGSS